MRSDEVARGRECVYPVVNRASHESEYGTFLDAWHDKRYFKPIVRQRSRFDWPSDAWRSVLRDVYEDRVRGLLAAAEHVSDVNAAVVGSALDTTTPLALWFDFEENDDAPPGAALCGNQIYGVFVAMPVPHHSTEPARPRHRREMT